MCSFQVVFAEKVAQVQSMSKTHWLTHLWPGRNGDLCTMEGKFQRILAKAFPGEDKVFKKESMKG